MSWLVIDQTERVVDGVGNSDILYVLRVSVTSAHDIEPDLFVVRVTDDSFSHVATVRDIKRYPVGKAQALSDDVDFYRVSTVTLRSANKVAITEQADDLQNRLKKVNKDWGEVIGVSFGGTKTFVYDSGEP